ncbi:outer membrane beta-barrel protein [Candidiatus Paracoxiella cheracis]|uniref:outer membrane beta-barrel protein n=1 Tax=Candidiatus Paracoxiella cheracis TaxID=3405120 RepID=UPI003BF59BCB
MLKQIVIGAAAVAAVGFSATTLAANGSGFYLRGQAGYGWVGKESQTIKLPPLRSNAASLTPTVSTLGNKGHGFAGRAAVGYALNQYLSVETGFTHYSDFKRNLGEMQVRNSAGLSGIQNAQAKTSLYAFDLMAKGTIPFDNFYAFGGVGVADVHAKSYALNSISSFGNISKPIQIWDASQKDFIRPKVAAGVGYNITQHIAVDVSYSRVFGRGKVSERNYLPDLNLASVGLTYKF